MPFRLPIIVNNGSLENFFGDGSDGEYNSVGNTTLAVTAHSGLAVKQYTSFTLNAEHTFTVDNPCRGLIIYVQGDCTISGTIDMSKKAGYGVDAIKPLVITKKDSSNVDTLTKYLQIATVLQPIKGGAGGNGGYGGGLTTDAGATRAAGGTAGTGRILLGGFGGGGGGGRHQRTGGASDVPGGVGGSISYAELGGGKVLATELKAAQSTTSSQTVFCWIYGQHGINGSGGCGSKRGQTTQNVAAIVVGGNGGECKGGGGGGSGTGYASTTGTVTVPHGGDGEPAGGFVTIICGGNLIFNSGAYIKANGGLGGAGSNYAGMGAGGGGGGGAGGGVVALYHNGTYTPGGTIEVNGGLGGNGGTGDAANSFESGQTGTSGSVGTIIIQQIA